MARLVRGAEVRVVAWVLGLSVARADPVPPARTERSAILLPAELASRERLRAARCDPSGLIGLVPGGPAACLGLGGEAAALATLSGAQLAAGIAVLATSEPQDELNLFGSSRYTFLLGATLPIAYGQGWGLLEQQRAQGVPYVPQDSTAGLFAAPFRLRVLGRPSVALGTVALVGGATALTGVLGEPIRPTLGRPNVLGSHPPPAVGYPALTALHGGLMIQVATAEEVVFRGLLQSSLVRGTDPTAGWALSSLIFGGLHATNALALPPEERGPYLLYAVPYITLTGSWIGLTYRWAGYSLAPPVALHFWYNTLVSGVGFLADPESHMFALRLGGRF